MNKSYIQGGGFQMLYNDPKNNDNVDNSGWENTDEDLKIVTDNYTVELRKNIFEGDIIYQSKEFQDYLNNFYIENSDVIDILNWRDMHGS